MLSIVELLERNKTFSENFDKAKLASMRKGQKPHTIVLTCSDSRVVPELIFNCGLGELFVVRVAGNVACDCAVLASIEYAVEHLKCKRLIVLGHTNCGAVCAACHGKEKGNIGELLCHITPAVEKANGHESEAVEENVRIQSMNLLQKSPVLSEKHDAGLLQIVNASYDLSTGSVRLI